MHWFRAGCIVIFLIVRDTRITWLHDNKFILLFLRPFVHLFEKLTSNASPSSVTTCIDVCHIRKWIGNATRTRNF